MHVRVVELMVAGVRRPREECLADPGTIGTLSIGDIPIGTAEKRPLHAAQLWERWGTSASPGAADHTARATAAGVPGGHLEPTEHGAARAGMVGRADRKAGGG